MKYSAVLIGATGLVGSELLQYLINDERISQIRVFVRRPTGIEHKKLTEYIVNFDDLNNWRQEVKGDILFSALGTTLKQVGSREAQRIVDYDYQLRVAQVARINGIQNVALVSAPGANVKSLFAYTKIKGELERDVMKLTFEKLTIIRPGLLKGPRTKKRFFEEKAGKIFNLFPIIPGLEALKPVSGKLVAFTCLEKALDQESGQRIFNPKDILQYLK
jgi:uncharacterized protein YbjT (DUF2867 family)